MADRRPLAVVTNWRDLSHPRAGGAEVVCDRIASRLVDEGYRVVLLCSSVVGSPTSETVNGYTVRRRGGQFTVYLWALLWLLRRRREVTAVVDSQNGIPFFTPLALRRRTPCLLLLHHVHQDQFALYFPRPVAALGRFLETRASRWIYRDRAIVAVSPSTRRGARGVLELQGPIVVAPPGWRVSPEVVEAGLPKTDHPSLVTVGRLVPHKRTDHVLRAFAELRVTVPDLQLDVVGDGADLNDLRRLADELGVVAAIHFHPGCSDVERDETVARAWLCVNASEGEGWGISVIECNALGTPVLAFDRPGLRDSIQDGVSGWLVAQGVPLRDALAAALELLASTTTATRLSRDSVRWAHRFTWEAMGSIILQALAIESQRLGTPPRTSVPLVHRAHVIRVPLDLVPEGWNPELDPGEALVWAVDAVDLHVTQASESEARHRLARLGVSDAAHSLDIEWRGATRQTDVALAAR